MLEQNPKPELSSPSSSPRVNSPSTPTTSTSTRANATLDGSNQDPNPDISSNFARPCLTCGATIHVADSVEQPHDCQPPSTGPELVARAWWNGHNHATQHDEHDQVVRPVVGSGASTPTGGLRSTVASLLTRNLTRILARHQLAEVLPGGVACTCGAELSALNAPIDDASIKGEPLALAVHQLQEIEADQLQDLERGHNAASGVLS